MYWEYSRPLFSMPMSLMSWGSPQPWAMKWAFIFFTPSPAILPKPMPRAIWCIIARSASALPQVSSRPPVRSLFRMPRW